MTVSRIFAAVLLTLSSIFVIDSIRASVNECWVNPCDSIGPCDDADSIRPGSFLYDKSIFDAPMFQNNVIGKKSKSRITLYGWMLTGVTVNNHGNTHEYGGSAYDYNNRRDSAGNITRPGMNDLSGNSYVLMIEQPTDWKVNQLWVGAKRDLDNRFGWGFQADFFYGTDARYSRNWSDRSFDYHWGSGDYFASFSQLYGTIGTKNLFVKIGKFAGGFSHEGLAAPREYFYTHANICYGRPLTTHGVMAEWHPNKQWTISAGWTAGVFNDFNNPYEDSGVLAKITYNFNKDMALSYRVYYNDKGARPGQHQGQIDCFNTFIFTWQINKDWFYMGEIAYTDGNTYTADQKVTSDAWGTNHHLIRTINDKLSVGFRWEFHHSRNSSFDITPVSGGLGGDMWNFTAAAHYKLTPKITFRPEIRYDYVDYKNGYLPFGRGNEKDQLSACASFIVLF